MNYYLYYDSWVNNNLEEGGLFPNFNLLYERSYVILVVSYEMQTYPHILVNKYTHVFAFFSVYINIWIFFLFHLGLHKVDTFVIIIFHASCRCIVWRAWEVREEN